MPDSSVPQPLAGYTGLMTITSWDGNTTYLTLSTTNAGAGFTGIFFGGQQQMPSNGIITLVIAATDTAAITWKTARYSMSLTNTNVTPNAITRLLYGTVSVFGSLP